MHLKSPNLIVALSVITLSPVYLCKCRYVSLIIDLFASSHLQDVSVFLTLDIRRSSTPPFHFLSLNET